MKNNIADQPASSTNSTNNQLWEAVRSGDPSAFETFVRNNIGGVSRRLCMMHDCPDEVDDCVMEAALLLWEKRGEITAKSHLRFWIVVAKRQANRRVATRFLFGVAEPELSARHDDVCPPSPSDVCAARDELAALDREVEKMNPNMRAIYAALKSGFGPEEIVASGLAACRDGARSLVARLRARLKASQAPGEHGEHEARRNSATPKSRREAA